MGGHFIHLSKQLKLALNNRSSAHIKQMAAEFFKKVTHKAIDFAKYLSMTFPFFVRDGIFAICDIKDYGHPMKA